jgi:hypothetical protein
MDELDSSVIDDIMIDLLADPQMSLETIAVRNSTTISVVEEISRFHHVDPVSRQDY